MSEALNIDLQNALKSLKKIKRGETQTRMLSEEGAATAFGLVLKAALAGDGQCQNYLKSHKGSVVTYIRNFTSGTAQEALTQANTDGAFLNNLLKRGFGPFRTDYLARLPQAAAVLSGGETADAVAGAAEGSSGAHPATAPPAPLAGAGDAPPLSATPAAPPMRTRPSSTAPKGRIAFIIDRALEGESSYYNETKNELSDRSQAELRRMVRGGMAGYVERVKKELARFKPSVVQYILEKASITPPYDGKRAIAILNSGLSQFKGPNELPQAKVPIVVSQADMDAAVDCAGTVPGFAEALYTFAFHNGNSVTPPPGYSGQVPPPGQSRLERQISTYKMRLKINLSSFEGLMSGLGLDHEKESCSNFLRALESEAPGKFDIAAFKTWWSSSDLAKVKDHNNETVGITACISRLEESIRAAPTGPMAGAGDAPPPSARLATAMAPLVCEKSIADIKSQLEADLVKFMEANKEVFRDSPLEGKKSYRAFLETLKSSDSSSISAHKEWWNSTEMNALKGGHKDLADKVTAGINQLESRLKVEVSKGAEPG